jgi:hypothetical protein
MYPCFVCLAIGLFLLSGTQTAWMLLLAGVFVGLGYGTFMSNGQAVCIPLNFSSYLLYKHENPKIKSMDIFVDYILDLYQQNR